MNIIPFSLLANKNRTPRASFLNFGCFETPGKNHIVLDNAENEQTTGIFYYWQRNSLKAQERALTSNARMVSSSSGWSSSMGSGGKWRRST